MTRRWESDDVGEDTSVFRVGAADVISFRRCVDGQRCGSEVCNGACGVAWLTSAARSEISIVISLPSSSLRGLWRVTVARPPVVVENLRGCTAGVGGDTENLWESGEGESECVDVVAGWHCSALIDLRAARARSKNSAGET